MRALGAPRPGLFESHSRSVSGIGLETMGVAEASAEVDEGEDAVCHC